MFVRPTLLMLALALVACGDSDRQAAPAASSPAALSEPRGPDALMLRIARTGGSVRVFAYPRLDTVVWSTSSAPAPAKVLGFDEEAGTIAYVDTHDRPARIDFRQGTASVVTKNKVTGLTAEGDAIFAITDKGSVERYAPGGTWKWTPSSPAQALFPQTDGSLLVLGEQRDKSVIWRVRPPDGTVTDTVVLPRVDRTLRTQVGDRLYLASGKELTGVRTKTVERTANIAFDDPVQLLAATPSGDRVFVVTRTDSAIEVVDRYQEKVTGRIELGRHPTELRVDPLGRYLLVRPAGRDSVVIIALGTNHVVGTVATTWRTDLPFVGPDGGVALAQGPNVVIVNGETMGAVTRVANGAADFWYPFRWSGFRPRAAALDQPVEFTGPPVDSTATDTVSVVDSGAVPKPDSASARAPRGFTVSFAALLAPEQARELAGRIHVGSGDARVVTSMRDGSTIFRVVMGPYPTRDEAERVGRESKQSYWVYEGGP